MNETKDASFSGVLRSAAFLAALLALGGPRQIGPKRPSPRALGVRGTLPFEPNLGQAGPEVRFLTRANGYTLFLCPTEAVLVRERPAGPFHSPEPVQDVARMRLLGANPGAKALGLEPQRARVNVLLGRDPGRWRRDVPQVGRARFVGVYPGIDLDYHGRDGRLEYDFRVAPGADPGLIRLKFDGTTRPRRRADGGLDLAWAGGHLGLDAPEVYQDGPGGRRSVAGRFVVQGTSLRFDVGNYDHGRALVIDPTVAYSTYIGGTVAGYPMACYGMKVDPSGNAYTIIQYTAGFPTTPGVYQPTLNGSGYNVLVIKLNTAGSALVWATYVGGNGGDSPTALRVDAAGEVYVCGETSSTDFPVSAGAFDPTFQPNEDAFVFKLNAAGSNLLYSTYLSGGSSAQAMDVDLSGCAYVTGDAIGDFPVTTGAFQTVPNDPSLTSANNIFVCKLAADAGSLPYATYLGGSGDQEPAGIAVDLSGQASVAGWTDSTDFPVTTGAFQGALQDSETGSFVTKFNAGGTGLVFSTYLGGSYDDEASAVCVDNAGDVLVDGDAWSTDFPTSPGVLIPSPMTVQALYVTKFNPSGALLWSTYLANSNPYTQDNLFVTTDICVDGGQQVYVGGTDRGVGSEESTMPCTADAFKTTLGGAVGNPYLAVLNPNATALVFATLWGGSESDTGPFLALDSQDSVYLAGLTISTNFPTTAGAYSQTLSVAGTDTYVSKFDFPTATFTTTPTTSPSFTLSPTRTPTLVPTATPPPLLLTPHYPNPDPASGGDQYLPYSLNVDAYVSIRVYDVAGELVREWSSDPDYETAGDHERAWDLLNNAGLPVASGVFLARIRATSGDQQQTAWEKCAVAR